MAEILVHYKKIGDEDVLTASKRIAKQVSELKKLASTPIEASFAKVRTTGDFEKLQQQVMRAREELKQLNIETGRSKIGENVVRSSKQAEQALEHLGITYDKVKGKMRTPLGGNEMLTAKNFSAQGRRRSEDLEHLGITYDKVSGKTSPLGLGDSMLNAKNFSAPKINPSQAYGSDSNIAAAMNKISQMKQMAALPVESSYFKNMLGGDFGKISEQVGVARNQLKMFNKEMENTKEKSKEAGVQLGFVTRLLAAMVVRKVAHDLVELTDSYTNLQNKLKTVHDSQAEVNLATADIIKIANQTRSPIDAVSTAYSRTARAVKDLGKSQFATTQFTSTLTKAIQIGGSTTAESTNAMIQLSQGMSSGTLRGDELRSVLEQLPVVAKLIAEGMGVTVGELRKLGAAGKLTSEQVFNAIVGSTSKVDAQFAKLTPTLEGLFQVMKNKFLVAIGQATPLTNILTKGLQFLADNFDVVIRGVTGLTAALGLFYGVKGISTLSTYLSGAASSLTVLGGALTGLIATLGLAVGAVVLFGDKMTETTFRVDQFGNKLAETQKHIDAFDFGHAGAEVFKKDLEDLVTKFARLTGLIDKEYKLKLTFNWDQMYEKLAGVIDFIRIAARPDITIGALAAKKRLENNPKGIYKGAEDDRKTVKEAEEYAHAMRNQVKKEQQEARERGIKENWDSYNKTNLKFNQMLKDSTPEPGLISKTEAQVKTEAEERKRAAKQAAQQDHGQTFADLIREAREETDQAFTPDSLERKIKDKFETALDKLKPSLKKFSGEVSSSMVPRERVEAELQKQIAGVVAKFEKAKDQLFKDGDVPMYQRLDKSGKFYHTIGLKEHQLEQERDASIAGLRAQAEQYLKQEEKLREVIAMEQTRIYYTKQRLEEEEESEKRVKKLLEEKLAIMEEMEQTRADDNDRFRNFKQSMSEQLNPSLKTNQEIHQLELFKNTTNDQKYIKLANERIEELKLHLKGLDKPMQTFAGQMDGIFGQNGVLVRGFADTLVSAKNLRQGLADLMSQIGKQALSAVIQLPLNMGIAALQSGLTGAMLPSFGGGQTASGANLMHIFNGMGPGKAAGGYTGNYPRTQPVDYVHGQEYVVNASATAKYRPMLESINKGGVPMTGSSGGPKVIINNAPGMIAEERENSNGDIEVQIIKAIQKHTPGVVAAHVRNSNSPISKAINTYTKSDRRRM